MALYILLSILVSINISRSEIHTEISSRHADSNVAGRRMSTFAKEQTRFRHLNIPKELRTAENSPDVNILPRAKRD